MNGARTEAFERRQVFTRRVPFMSIETILRVRLVQCEHFGITDGFREYGCCGNFTIQPIAPHNRARWGFQVRAAIAIDPRLVGRRIKRLDGTAHGEQRRLQNIERINFLNARESHGPRPRVAPYLRCERRSTAGTQQFRIPKPRDGSTPIENNGRGDHRPGNRSPPCFVNAADVTLSARHRPAPLILRRSP